MNRNNILLAFAVNAVITVVIAIGLTYNEPDLWLQYLYGSFIFSNCIGFTIFGLRHYVGPFIRRFPKVVGMLMMTALYLVGGAIGSEAALGFFTVILGAPFGPGSHVRMLLFNLVLAGVFGTVASLYFSTRERAARLSRELREKELTEERLTRLKTKAELEALQSKINPHFLFNTLNSIASLISENPKAAEETVEKLSELFRYTLMHIEKSTVTLGEELDLIRTYLEIEKVRLGDRLQYDVKCGDRIRGVELPAMLIQPLVENSIKHGIAPVIGGGTILIEAREANGMCVIAVRDSGRGFQIANDASGFGLRSIEERLKLLYGEKASLEIVQNGHTEIVITIPLA